MAESERWVEWREGNSPPEIAGLRCDIKFRNGEVFEDENSYDWWENWTWDCDENSQIVGYRQRLS